MGHIDSAPFFSEDGGPRLMQKRAARAVRAWTCCASDAESRWASLRPLIAYSVPVDGIVLDLLPVAAPTLVAARDIGRRAIGIEVREDYCEAAVKRLAQGVLAA